MSKIGAGTSCVLVKDDGFRTGEKLWFFRWLENEGFTYYPLGTSSGVGWVYINLTSKVYTGGKTGVSVTSVIANHAISIEDFMTIYKIYEKYKGLSVLRMNWQEQYGHKYDGMKGESFLVAFFRDKGISEDEICFYRRWTDGDFGNLSNLAADNDGLKCAHKCAHSILEYRNMSVEDVLANFDDAVKVPWAWPGAKRFQPLLLPPHSAREVNGIYLCSYGGKEYLFGVGKEEVPITAEMSKNGNWYVYTWSD